MRLACKQFKKDDFNNANALENLCLVNNKLRVITNSVFSKATNLKDLMLNLNELTTIEDFAFSGLNKLSEIRLMKNKLTIMKRNTFAGAPDLSSIYLDDNEIETIEEVAFDIPKLEKLFLVRNKIRSLADNVFAGAPILQLVSMSENGLTHIGQLFHKCKHLEDLYLEDNQITDIDLRSLARCNIKVLVLRKSGFHFDENFTMRTPYEYVNSITYLDLTDNKLNNSDVLMQLNDMGFNNNLHTLNLRNNSFTVIDDLSMLKQNFRNIEFLVLRGNLFEKAVKTSEIPGVTIIW